ncbi:MAG: magnesium chelatase [Dethiobacter sp.]|jgi:magnesium chelatase subunit I|nr:magnesium chelatase [Dethiobacter sp.]
MNWNDLIFHQGNEELQRFIELGIFAAGLEIPFHFHVEGVRGTGKTTLIRAARSQLPLIEKIEGCFYNCRPDQPHCPVHQASSGTLASQFTPMPFLEISHSAKVGTVAGSIDLEKLTAVDNPSAAVLPGTLPRAHRGIVFVDEINRLADTSPSLVDILLDAMGTKPGRVQIEETGLTPVELQLAVSVWAASNPDEEPGPLQEIRRQLSDRFDFAVRIERPSQAETVRAIINAGQNNVYTGTHGFSLNREQFSTVTLEENVEKFLAETYIRFNLESIRAVQAARLGALLHAAWQGKYKADFTDLAAVLPAALRHRLEAPKLLEITQFMRNAVENAKKSSDNRQQHKEANPGKDSKLPGYPALWRGIWQRVARQKEGLDTAKSGLQLTKDDNTMEEEKKKEAIPTIPEETGTLK